MHHRRDSSFVPSSPPREEGWGGHPPSAALLEYITVVPTITPLLSARPTAGDCSSLTKRHVHTVRGLLPHTQYRFAVGRAVADADWTRDRTGSFTTHPTPGNVSALRLWVLGAINPHHYHDDLPPRCVPRQSFLALSQSSSLWRDGLTSPFSFLLSAGDFGTGDKNQQSVLAGAMAYMRDGKGPPGPEGKRMPDAGIMLGMQLCAGFCVERLRFRNALPRLPRFIHARISTGLLQRNSKTQLQATTLTASAATRTTGGLSLLRTGGCSLTCPSGR